MGPPGDCEPAASRSKPRSPVLGGGAPWSLGRAQTHLPPLNFRGRTSQHARPASPDGDSEIQRCPVTPGEATLQIHPTAGPLGSGALSLAKSVRPLAWLPRLQSRPTSVRFCLWLPGGSRELPCEPWPSTLALLGWRNRSPWGVPPPPPPPVPCSGRRETQAAAGRGPAGRFTRGPADWPRVAMSGGVCAACVHSTASSAAERAALGGPRLLAPCIPFTAPGSAAGQRAGTRRRLFTAREPSLGARGGPLPVPICIPLCDPS